MILNELITEAFIELSSFVLDLVALERHCIHCRLNLRLQNRQNTLEGLQMDNALFLTSHTEEKVVVVEVKLEEQSTTVSLCVLDLGGESERK
mmetsp:Transcript_18817/g.29504  ORF Transcript_18817/g.29504 Transcript_18817/m.29504 type:complete len:92 (-) Transcript_18817:18-293(-)